MWYIGVDTHKLRCNLVAKKQDGTRTLRRRFANTEEGWKDAFHDVPPKSFVAFEAIGWYEKIVNVLEEIDMQPVMANPREIDLIAKSTKKTDQHDAETLCDLLRANFLPKCYIPTSKARRLRELGRSQDELVKMATMTKNRIHALIASTWLVTPDVDDLFGKKGRAWLHAIKLEPERRLLILQTLCQIDLFEAHQESIKSAMAALTTNDEDVRLLLSLQGVAHTTAYVLRGQIDDVNRFPNRRKMRSNFGIIPSIRNTDETRHAGRITKKGNSQVRKVICQAGMHFARRDPNAGRKRERLILEKKRQKAIVATGTDVLDAAYQVLKTRTPYHHVDPALWAKKQLEHEQLAKAGQKLLATYA